MIGLLIGIMNALLPMQEINEMIFSVKEPEALPLEYKDSFPEFATDYSQENPATKTHFVAKYVQRMESILSSFAS